MALFPVVRDNLRSMAGGLPRPFWILWAGTFVNRGLALGLLIASGHLALARTLGRLRAERTASAPA